MSKKAETISVNISEDLKAYDSVDERNPEEAEEDNRLSEDQEHLPKSKSEIEAEEGSENLDDSFSMPRELPDEPEEEEEIPRIPVEEKKEEPLNEEEKQLVKDLSKPELNKKRKRGAFRFKSKTLFGTWPQCTATKEECLEMLKSKGCIRAVVCHENHQPTEEDPNGGDHLHCWAEFAKTIDTRDPYYFKIGNFEGHYEGVKNKIAVIKYVEKNGDFIEYNFVSSAFLNAKQRHSCDINRFLLTGEKTIDEIVDENPELLPKIGSLQRGLTIYKNLKANRIKRKKVKCFWLCGDPGIGKSYLVKERFPNAYRKSNNKWWDYYVDQKVVILEDFDNKNLYHEIKIWADNYQFYAEVKGGTISPVYEVFIVTSNYTIEEIFKEEFDVDENNIANLTRLQLKKLKINQRLVKAIKRRFKQFELVVPQGMNFLPKLPDAIDKLPY